MAKLGSKIKTDSLGRPLKEGNRVAYTYFYPCGRRYACLNGEPAACPKKIERPLGPGAFPHLHGAFADHYYLRPGGAILKVPDALADEAVAGVNCALSQVIYGLHVAGVRLGDSVLIQGREVSVSTLRPSPRTWAPRRSSWWTRSPAASSWRRLSAQITR